MINNGSQHRITFQMNFKLKKTCILFIFEDNPMNFYNFNYFLGHNNLKIHQNYIHVQVSTMSNKLHNIQFKMRLFFLDHITNADLKLNLSGPSMEIFIRLSRFHSLSPFRTFKTESSHFDKWRFGFFFTFIYRRFGQVSFTFYSWGHENHIFHNYYLWSYLWKTTPIIIT